MDLIANYGLFLAKIITVVIAIAAVVFIITSAALRRNQPKGELKLTNLSEQYQDMQQQMQVAMLDSHQQKLRHKEEKKKNKLEAKEAKARAKRGETASSSKPTAYVIDFKGSMDAHEVSSLREEITAILSVYQPNDKVLLRLESPGGVVHGYGLAASQLQRLREHKIPLVAMVDKVAASGGYMMACVADRIIAAPFSIIGSIGVVAQVPNFNKLLKKHDVDIELHTAGQYKRTLTLFGENTEEGRDKFREDLNETHQLFKQFVHEMRPSLDLDAVATGEHWYGIQAKEKGLVDDISTSDDVILETMKEYDLIQVRFAKRKKMMDRFTNSAANSLDRLLLRWWQKGEKPML